MAKSKKAKSDKPKNASLLEGKASFSAKEEGIPFSLDGNRDYTKKQKTADVVDWIFELVKAESEKNLWRAKRYKVDIVNSPDLSKYSFYDVPFFSSQKGKKLFKRYNSLIGFEPQNKVLWYEAYPTKENDWDSQRLAAAKEKGGKAQQKAIKKEIEAENETFTEIFERLGERRAKPDGAALAFSKESAKLVRSKEELNDILTAKLPYWVTKEPLCSQMFVFDEKALSKIQEECVGTEFKVDGKKKSTTNHYEKLDKAAWKAMKKRLKKEGFCRCELWNLDSFMAVEAYRRLAFFADTKLMHGHPCNFVSYKHYKRSVVDSILTALEWKIVGFPDAAFDISRTVLGMTTEDAFEVEKEANSRIQYGLELLGKNFNGFWD